MNDFDLKKYLIENKITTNSFPKTHKLKENLESFPDEEGTGIHITSDEMEGDLFLTMDKNAWEEMKAEGVSDGSGKIKAGNVTIYWSFGWE